MSGFNMPPGVSPYDIPGNSAEEVRYERTFESAMTDLIDGCDLPAHLNERELRDLLSAVMVELFSQRRDFDRTSAEHHQTCVVFAKAAIEAAAKSVAERIAEEA